MSYIYYVSLRCISKFRQLLRDHIVNMHISNLLIEGARYKYTDNALKALNLVEVYTTSPWCTYRQSRFSPDTFQPDGLVLPGRLDARRFPPMAKSQDVIFLIGGPAGNPDAYVSERRSQCSFVSLNAGKF